MNKTPPLVGRWVAASAAMFGASAVALGAAVSHGLSQHYAAEQLTILNTAVHYQFWHALALLYVARLPRCALHHAAALSFVLGVLCFSGSLYGLVLTPLSFGLLTPLGGLLLILGWLLILVATLRRQPA